MHINRQKLTTLIATVALISIILTAACSSSDPEALDIPITIKAGVMEPETINVKQGDMVTLKILADDGGEFHLHTYDIESEIQLYCPKDHLGKLEQPLSQFKAQGIKQ